MTDKDVLRVLTSLMAESLPAGSAEVEALGHILEVDMDKWWAPDDAFFDLLRDKGAINAMVEEVAGNRTAAQYRTDTAKAQKDVISGEPCRHPRPQEGRGVETALHALSDAGLHEAQGPCLP